MSFMVPTVLKNKWDHDAKAPPKPGIYAILYCWEPQEGVFDGAAYWNGKKWDQELPIGAFSFQPFKTIKEAEEWAERNN